MPAPPVDGRDEYIVVWVDNCANTRTPEVTWGDVKAQVNTNTYGLSKFAELFGKYGTDNVLACWKRWMEIVETELRNHIGPRLKSFQTSDVDIANWNRARRL